MNARPTLGPVGRIGTGALLLALWAHGALAAVPALSVFTREIPISASGYRTALANATERTFADGVTRIADVPYAQRGDGQALTLDLYLPASPASQRPLLIYIHGGGWSGGDARTTGAFEDFPALLARFAAQGYAVASVNYRLSGAASFPAPVDDIHAAIVFLQEHAAQYALDPRRLAVWGNSSGGHLAAITALGCDQPGSGNGCPKVLISWFGIYDLQRIMADDAFAPIRKAARGLMGCAETPCAPAIVTAASATPRLGQALPPALLIHGTADDVVPYGQSQALAQTLRANGGQVQLILIPGVGHSLVDKNSQPVTQAANYKALRATLEFLRQHL